MKHLHIVFSNVAQYRFFTFKKKSQIGWLNCRNTIALYETINKTVILKIDNKNTQIQLFWCIIITLILTASWASYIILLLLLLRLLQVLQHSHNNKQSYNSISKYTWQKKNYANNLRTLQLYKLPSSSESDIGASCMVSGDTTLYLSSLLEGRAVDLVTFLNSSTTDI